MRKRNRPEYRVRSYRYWARPLTGLPDTFWQLAHKMQETWNSLVEAWEKSSQLAPTLANDEQKVVWAAHRETCRRIILQSGLNWECGPAVLERFETACRMADRGERGQPKCQHEIRSVMIPHCYTSGGIPAAGLFVPADACPYGRLRPKPIKIHNVTPSGSG